MKKPRSKKITAVTAVEVFKQCINQPFSTREAKEMFIDSGVRATKAMAASVIKKLLEHKILIDVTEENKFRSSDKRILYYIMTAESYQNSIGLEQKLNEELNQRRAIGQLRNSAQKRADKTGIKTISWGQSITGAPGTTVLMVGDQL